MAACPSGTTCTGSPTFALCKAWRIKKTSSSLSSTRRIVGVWVREFITLLVADHDHSNKPAGARESYGVKTYCLIVSRLRQFNPEPASGPRGAFNSHLTRHAFNQPAHDGQPNSCSFVGTVCVAALE